MRPTPKRLINVLRSITSQDEPERPRANASRRAHVRAMRRILTDPNVVGVGISRKVTDGVETAERCICFYVEHKRPHGDVHSDFLVPAVLSSFDGRTAFTDVKELGRFYPDGVGSAGIQSGKSVGNREAGTSGTIGAIVDRDGAAHILSASHVLARCGLGEPGENILSPGDGVFSVDWVADLTCAEKFLGGGGLVNQMDAALARVRDECLQDVVDDIANATAPVTVGNAAMNREVTLLGAESRQTSGVVKDCHFHFVMNYPGVGDVGFHDQVLCSRFTEEGDSGALVLDAKTGQVLGLHLGSARDRDPRKSGSIFSPIEPIRQALGFTFRARS